MIFDTETFELLFSPLMFNYWLVMTFIFGICIGSFLNVCIWRIPLNESVIFAQSHCTKCNHKITWYENIPLFSYLALRGKCSSCGQGITIRYFLVELVCGLIFAGLFLKATFAEQSLYWLINYFAMTMLLICTAFIDVEHKIIPNKLTYCAIIFGLLTGGLFPQLFSAPNFVAGVYYGIIRLVATGAVLYMLNYIFKRLFKQPALGGGDIKYLAACAVLLGYSGALGIMFWASLLGTLGGFITYFVRRKNINLSSHVITFGPYLAIGTLLWMFVDVECYSYLALIIEPGIQAVTQAVAQKM